MKKYFLIFLMLAEISSIWMLSGATLADAPLAQELSISQIKITGDEILVLRNKTNSNLQLGNFWLQYYNDFNLANVGISNSSSQLPAVTLQPNQEILLTIGAAADCGQVWVAKLPFSLKDSAGLLQVVAVSQSSGVLAYKPEDQVSWSSKTSDPRDIKGVSSSASAQLWYKNAGVWQTTTSPPGCTIVGTTVSQSTNTVATLNQSNSSPPSVVLGAETGSSPSSSLPPSDIGLTAPQISELLPNPAPPQADATDEFIELYNPNNSTFDLSGFTLQVGTSTLHNFTFPSGQFSLLPHEFKAFYITQTGLSLANDGGQALVLDPSGNVVAKTDVYSDAKDGYAWIFANGLWQWTTSATPDAQNKILAPVASTTKPSSSKSSKKAVSSSSKRPKSTKGASTQISSQPTTSTSNLHPGILAVIGGAALIYALYEYRHDLANAVYRFRRNRRVGQAAGQTITPPGSN